MGSSKAPSQRRGSKTGSGAAALGRTAVRRSGALSRWLFVTFSCFYLLGTAGHIYTPDGVIMFRVTRALVDRHELSIPPIEGWEDFGGTWVPPEGSHPARFYPMYGIGFSLAAIPCYLVGSLLEPFALEGERDLFDRPLYYDASRSNFREAFQAFAASWTNSFVVALTVACLYLLCLELGMSERMALASALLAGLATPLWHYSKTFFSEPLAALSLVSFLLLARKGSSHDRPARLWLMAGLLLGCAVLTKIIHLVLFLPAAVLLVGYARGLGRRDARLRLALAGAGFSLVLAVALGYNLLRFGSPLETGYGVNATRWTTPFLEGVTGLLVSPGRGLILYCPIVLLVPMAASSFFRAFHREAVFILLSLCLLVGLYARWFMWEGGWCWGPRFLLPVIPLLVLPCGHVLDRLWKKGRSQRVRVLLVIALSAVVAASGVMVNDFDYHWWLKDHYEANAASFAERGVDDYYDLLRWDVRYAPIVRYWGFPNKDFFMVVRALEHPGLVLGLYGCFLIGFAFGLAQLVRPARPGQERGHEGR